MRNTTKLPTADQFSDQYDFLNEWDDRMNWDIVLKFAKDFAKLHVKTALGAASIKAKAYVDGQGDWVSSNCKAKIDRKSILDAYPETNIL